MEIMAEDMRRRLSSPELDYDMLNDVMAEMSKMVLDALEECGADRARAKKLMEAMIMQTGLYYDVRKRIEQSNGSW